MVGVVNYLFANMDTSKMGELVGFQNWSSYGMTPKAQSMFEIQRRGTRHRGKTVDAFTPVAVFDYAMPTPSNAVIYAVQTLRH